VHELERLKEVFCGWIDEPVILYWMVGEACKSGDVWMRQPSMSGDGNGMAEDGFADS